MEKRAVAEKIKKKTALFFGKIYETFADFKVSMVILLIWTAAETAMWIVEEMGRAVDVMFPKYDLSTGTAFFVLLFLFSLFFETCLGRKKKLLLFLYPLAAVFCGLLSYFLYQDQDATNFYRMDRIWGLVAGCVILLIIFTVYGSYRKLELSFPEYVGGVLHHFFQMLLLIIIVLIGITFVIVILDELFSWYWDGEEVVLILQNLYVIPYSVYALNHTKKESSSTFNIVVKYIVNFFSACILVIGYVYILKIIFSGKMPSNEIFAILAALFVVSAPIWILNEGYRDGTLRSKIVSALPYIFAPLILMQIYSIAVRIWSYGLTASRYAAVMVVVFEIGTILVWKFARNHCERLLLLLAALVFISVAPPGINMYALSVKNQKYLLDKYLQKLEAGEELSETEYKRFKGAYQYQQNRASMEEFEKYAYAQEFIKEEEQNRKSTYQTFNFHGCQLAGEIDTDGFTKMNMMNQSEEYDETEEKTIDFSKFKFYKRESGEEIEIDLSEIYEKALEFKKQNPGSGKEEFSEYIKKYNKIVLDDNRVFYVNHFEVKYVTVTSGDETEVKTAKDVNISGMLLER